MKLISALYSNTSTKTHTIYVYTKTHTLRLYRFQNRHTKTDTNDLYGVWYNILRSIQLKKAHTHGFFASIMLTKTHA